MGTQRSVVPLRHNSGAEHVPRKVRQRPLRTPVGLLPHVVIHTVASWARPIPAWSSPGWQLLLVALALAQSVHVVAPHCRSVGVELGFGLVAAGRGQVALGLHGVVEVGVPVAGPELASGEARLVHAVPVRHQGGHVGPRRGVHQGALDSILDDSRHLGLADLHGRDVCQGAPGRLVLARPRKEIALQVTAPRALGRLRLRVAASALHQELVLQREQRLYSLVVVLHVLAELTAPVAVHALDAALLLAHVQEVQVLLLTLHLLSPQILLPA
mmetsp:Transcript_41347/g.128849  ORF Transcript_41347/g.128849 Transcript_41347/m.128849 type:complete len:271 (-) Transcript_41347:1024-1836(-)